MLMPMLLASALMVVGVSLGYILSRFFSSPGQRSQQQGSSDKNNMSSDSVELQRSMRRMEQENNELTLFFVTFPDLIRQLNTNRTKRNIAPVLLRLLEVIFEPGQICIFYKAQKGDCFKLATSKGLPRGLEEGSVVVRSNEGRVGWVAEHQMVMDARDFTTSSKGHGESAKFAERIQIDLCAPMVDVDDQTTVGIITVGALSRSPRNEKKMIKMVADLGSMGIKNAEYHLRIQTLANEDGLTSLYNKRYGTKELSLNINSAEQRKQPLSVFLFDIDHFKKYNDTQGHLAGDEILRQLGRLVKAAIRADDFAVRFGGEEFLIVFQDTDKEGALIAAEKIRRQIESFPFDNKDQQPGGNLTISGGVASFPLDSRSSTELVRLADEALYLGKKQGRNRVMACRTPYLSDDPDADNAQPMQTGR
ncbi:MAG: GGDEF domain-containing protein [Acidobacteria bacterium]|nr:GGDEF domain-containing protein [Acidobacteriota bacterium]